MKTETKEEFDLLVVGAGPVGLFAALEAADRGLSVQVLDQSFQGFGRGYASLLHAQALRLLGKSGVAHELLGSGQPIKSLRLYADGVEAKTLHLPSPALTVSQARLQEALLSALRQREIQPLAPFQATTIAQGERGVEVGVIRRELVTLGSPAHYSDWEPVESLTLRPRFVLGADGYDSRVRAVLGFQPVTVGATQSFAIFEFPASGPRDGEGQLVLGGEVMSAMVPLANGRARWAFQIVSGLDEAPDVGRLRSLLGQRAPWFADGAADVDWGTVIQFERRLTRRFGHGRVWLAGDAAHVTSPFGAQSMNVGLAEASELVERISRALRGGSLGPLEEYQDQRQREWHKLLGVNVRYRLEPHAPRWLVSHARSIVPALPASGPDLDALLAELGLALD